MTVMKLDSKALQTLIATFDEETKIEFQRCVIKEIVSKTFLNYVGLEKELEEQLKESLTLKVDKSKLDLREYTKTMIEDGSFVLQSKIDQAINEMVLDDASFQITDELCEKLLNRILRRSSIAERLKDYEERQKHYIYQYTEKTKKLQSEAEQLVNELKEKINNQEQMIADIVARRLSGKE